ncbi:SAV_2336 N-terminal domain-related protein [Alkalinema pantanalense CENA528]|uniref:SAV_2336 N-terminal domain-related protein n=1 Tax=Alkalinema pantanalense TaxID=1620705 RepID=UPI003D6DA94B
MQPFVSALGAELGLTSKDIADIIWLALQMQNLEEVSESTTPLKATSPEPKQASRSSTASPEITSVQKPEQQSESESQPKPAEIHSRSTNEPSFGQQLAFQVPDARSVREPLSLARSLKPLLQKLAMGWSTTLDEVATVERIAEEGLWLPVFQPALEPWLDLALVVDESLSMQIWQRTIAELRRLLSHYGVFRDVRVWSLVTDEPGEVKLYPGMGATARRQAAQRPSMLVDPSGRRLILIATDCVSSGWQNESLLSALNLWAMRGPLAIVQMLPEWLWARTGLGLASAVKLQALLPGVPNQQLTVSEVSGWDDIDLEAGIKVPVVTLEPKSVAGWAEMVTGKSGVGIPGFVLEEEFSAPRTSGLHSATATKESAEQRVQQFRLTASPMARRLAGLLAAAPLISLPVVRILQDRLLPESRQVHVAEVFLGGLLKALGDIETEANPDMVQYEFLDGVREVLLESVPTSNAVNVLEEVSRFVAERLGRSLEEFAAVLRHPQQIEDQAIVKQSRPFARVTAQVLRQLGGEYAQFAEELEIQWKAPPRKVEKRLESPYKSDLATLQWRLEMFRMAGRNLQLDPLVTVKALAQFGVEYQTDLLEQLEQAIEEADDRDNKFVFTGHRGCGKSTLLAELGFRLIETGRYFVVMFSISDTIERSAVNHVNILFSIAVQLIENAELRSIKLQPGIKKRLYGWLSEHTQTEWQGFESEIETSGNVGSERNISKLLNFLAKVKSGMKVNSVIRTEIMTEFVPRVPDLIAKINEIRTYIENATEQRVLVIIDDLDKLDLAVIDSIFSKNIQALLAPNCHILYTIPISTLREVSLKRNIEAVVKQIHTMRVAKFFSRSVVRKVDRVPDAACVAIFEEVLDRRLPTELIEPEVKRQIILKSGGVLRELIRLVDLCCGKCMQQIRRQIRQEQFAQPPVVINQQILDQVLTDVQIEFAEPLGQYDFELLKQIYEDFKPRDPENQRFLDLLHGLYILEYRNAVLWYDLNPIVIDLLRSEGVID